MTTRRGIILAGGSGSRLYPLTLAVSKQLLPVYDKPMIYYPLSVLMAAGLREVAIITTARDQSAFQALLGDGSDLGMRIDWIVQPRPEGLAQALILAESFLDGRASALILGDNLFHGGDFRARLERADAAVDGATVLSYPVRAPERYGVLEFGPDGAITDIIEKPARPPSNRAVTGLYFYDGQAPTLARSLTPSGRGELEITDLNRLYLKAGKLRHEPLDAGYAWLDTGTHDSLIQAGEFIRTLEARMGTRIGAVEAEAFANGWIDAQQLRRLAARCPNDYGEHLRALAG